MRFIKPGKINWQAGLALDVIRLFSALLVMLHHAYIMWNLNFIKADISFLGHFSVIVFFVLSGYLISFTTANNNRGKIQYLKARLSRLYSILFPAICITALSQVVIFLIDRDLNSHYIRSPLFIRYVLSLFFLNEIWSYSLAPPLNGPLWSLSYEFWYYIIFGLWFFYSKSWKTIVFPLIACFIAGPSILLMMPVWLMGSIAYKLPRLIINRKLLWVLCVSFLTTGFLLMPKLVSLPYILGKAPFYHANQFITDMIVGLFVAITFWLLPLNYNDTPKPKLLIKFRKVADLTFPLYLMHYPLLILFKAVFGYQTGSISQYIIAVLSTIFFIALAGSYFESKRYLWDKFFESSLIKSLVFFKNMR